MANGISPQSGAAPQENPYDSAVEKVDEFLAQKGITKFTGDPEKDIEAVAQKTSLDDWEGLVDAINDSLNKGLKEGTSIDSLWDFLQQEGCQVIALLEGYMRFFKDAELKEEISVKEHKPKKEGLTLGATDAEKAISNVRESKAQEVFSAKQQERLEFARSIQDMFKDKKLPTNPLENA